ncbi:hypothetical protein BDP27DRAFT_1334158 [Rhodocollybia butyracea]|uniref:Uncharacterized protein n=1 Tax=Rhodocollybia butyracea TaxID=206335 RepID=A0A9P5U2L2_9AGAR|nr:hypothetical protein BDP27DRAFT_1334158 [Rhodocollybia butyracea]
MSVESVIAHEVEAGSTPHYSLLALTRPDFIMLNFIVLLYGSYTMLFSLYTYLQIQHHERKHYYQSAVVVLYILATAALVLTILSYDQENLLWFSRMVPSINPSSLEVNLLTYEYLQVAEAAIYVVANTIADALLLYRCYIVWGARKYIIIVPSLICIVNTVLALVALGAVVRALQSQTGNSEIDHAIKNFSPGNIGFPLPKSASIILLLFLAINLFTNIMLTGLIAGRIWWISKETRQSLGEVEDSKRRTSLNSVVKLILESGSLYPVALAFGLGLNATNTVNAVEPILTVIVGMAATLIMVMTDLDLSIHISTDQSHWQQILEPDGMESDRTALSSSYELQPNNQTRDVGSEEYRSPGWGIIQNKPRYSTRESNKVHKQQITRLRLEPQSDWLGANAGWG